MNKVVFICLLSISLCYSSPTDLSSKAGPTITVDPKTENVVKTNTPLVPTHAAELTNKTEPAHTELAPVTTQNPTTTTTNATTAKTENATTTVNTTTNTTPENKDKTKKADKPTEAPAKPEETTTLKPVVPDNKTTVKPDVKPVTTPTVETTVKPTHADDKQDVVQARGFDGASFIGGMILSMGLLAVGFIGFKYYKNHAERNYHTL